MKEHSQRVRTRFAPSPTGLLHIGGVRTALFSYLIARHFGGDFVLRIEDTDRERLVEGGVEQILASLDWLGLKPDEGPDSPDKANYGPYVQSERHQQGLYSKYAAELVASGKAYYSSISPEEFANLKAGAIDRKEAFVYRQSMEPSEAPTDTSGLPIRLKVEPGETSWNDEVHGDFKFNHDIVDDFVILKADGYPTYNFANVIDDHLMEISHVVRGPEFLASTPKHALLYDYFGWDRPKFAHCPVILGPDGKKKLSKRDGDIDVLDYKEKGFLPAAILNFLSMLGWNDGSTQELFSLSDLTQKFSLGRVQKSPAQFDIERLNWMNGEYIRNVLSQEEYLEHAREALKKSGYEVTADEKYIDRVLLLDRERVKTFSEIPGIVEFFFVPPAMNSEFTGLLTKKADAKSASLWLGLVLDALPETDFTEEGIEKSLRGVAEQNSLHVGELFYTIRVAITGRTAAPGLFETIHTLGLDQTTNRLQAAQSSLA